ncbi:uncharacterized protein LOC135097824 isoform X2 [Scylla paramamosain]|uniref:uncharacterized protein LOC135097824 isoform X2 n=1 Tax=Scylla paramamosain TaxID=85552 RepID=UPI0030831239
MSIRELRHRWAQAAVIRRRLPAVSGSSGDAKCCCFVLSERERTLVTIYGDERVGLYVVETEGGNTESKWKKPWETSMTQEQAHLTGSLVTDRWFRPTGRHDVSATTQGVKPRGGRGAFKRHQLASSPFSFTTGSEG